MIKIIGTISIYDLKKRIFAIHCENKKFKSLTKQTLFSILKIGDIEGSL